MILTKNKKNILILVIIVIILLLCIYFWIKNSNSNESFVVPIVDNSISKVSIIGGDNSNDPNKFNLLVSSDGLDWRPASLNWSSNASPTGGQITIPEIKNNNLFNTCFAGASGLDETGRALFVIVGNGNNSIAYSYDGVTWVGLGNTIFESGEGGRSISWNGGIWVAVGISTSIYYINYDKYCNGHTAAYSYNGRDWFGAGTSGGNMYAGGHGLCVTFIGRSWISGGYSGATRSTSPNLWTSNDGINWKPLNKLDRNSNKVMSLVYNEKILLSTSDNGISYANISSDIIYDNNNNITNINWKYVNKQYNPETQITLPNTTQYLSDYYTCVAWNGKQFVAGGAVLNIGKSYSDPSVIDKRDKSIIYSSDGITWYLANTSGVDQYFSESCRGISWNGSLWIATGGSQGGNTISTSTDGINWSKIPKSDNLIYNGLFAISGINASLIKLPTTTQPTTTRPTTTQPTTTRPTTTQPTTTQPTTTQPTTTQPTTTRPTTTQPTTTQPTTTQPTTTQPTTTQPTTTQPTTTQQAIQTMQTMQTMQYNDTTPTIPQSVGPCKKLEIIANNMKFAGILILNQLGNNIFNNDYVQLKPNKIIGNVFSESLTPTSTPTPTPTNNNKISNLFEQTSNIILDYKDKCNYDTSNNILNNKTYKIICNPNSDNSKLFEINPDITFNTPQNTKTTLTIDIPKDTNINKPIPTGLNINYISAVILFMDINVNNNNNVNNNVNMIESLEVNLYDYDNKINCQWKNITTNPPISSSTQFLKLMPPRLNGFNDIKKSYFENVYSFSVSYEDYNPAVNSNSSTVMPTSTLSYGMISLGNKITEDLSQLINDIKTMFPDISQKQIEDLLNSGIDINKLKENNENTINNNGTVLNSQGINLSNNFRGPSTNVMQVDFTGTSNIYSPYLYYNKGTTEKFDSVKNIYR